MGVTVVQVPRSPLLHRMLSSHC